MKKNIILIIIIFGVIFALFIYYLIFTDKYELILTDETYFYKEDVDESVEEQSGGLTLKDAYDYTRYRKYKICCEYALIEGNCVIRLLDAGGNILKEWNTDSESFEDVIDKKLFDDADKILVVSEQKNCTGKCKLEIYGKKRHVLNLKELAGN